MSVELLQLREQKRQDTNRKMDKKETGMWTSGQDDKRKMATNSMQFSEENGLRSSIRERQM